MCDFILKSTIEAHSHFYYTALQALLNNVFPAFEFGLFFPLHIYTQKRILPTHCIFQSVLHYY